MDKTIVEEAKLTKKHSFKNIVEKMDRKAHIEVDKKAEQEREQMDKFKGWKLMLKLYKFPNFKYTFKKD